MRSRAMPESWVRLGTAAGNLAALHFRVFAITSSRQPPAMRKDFKIAAHPR